MLMPPRDYLTLVSGLPRSGTSLLMQMLSAGGMPVLADHQREADADNPRGYFELEKVKQLKQDATWLTAARGQAVKIIYRLLYDLPAGHSYRVIFLRRDLNEVLRSQRAMLERMGTPAKAEDDARLAEIFTRDLARLDAWLAHRTEFRVLNIEHRAVVERPWEEAARVAEFLDGGLDLEAMTRAVDPALYRQRTP
jgi:hypothetical protein